MYDMDDIYAIHCMVVWYDRQSYKSMIYDGICYDVNYDINNMYDVMIC